MNKLLINRLDFELVLKNPGSTKIKTIKKDKNFNLSVLTEKKKKKKKIYNKKN